MIKAYEINMNIVMDKRKNLEEEINKCIEANNINENDIINVTWKDPRTAYLICRNK